MAKGQKKSTRETRKPKQEKAKPAVVQSTFAGAIERNAGKASIYASGAAKSKPE